MTHNVDPKLSMAFLKMSQSLERIAAAMEKANDLKEKELKNERTTDKNPNPAA